ncbi:MAG: OmpA family protein [Saprospiraceae bacterium]|nr:OmpA family protein [Saprospiraceae bacterium]
MLAESNIEIMQLSQLLTLNPRMKIKISGHTDNVGKSEDNMSLSQKRAKSVAEAIIKAGINQDRITVEGMGENAPIDSNESETGRQQNRRTEFVIFR